jgi:hypothetical protein
MFAIRTSGVSLFFTGTESRALLLVYGRCKYQSKGDGWIGNDVNSVVDIIPTLSLPHTKNS